MILGTLHYMAPEQLEARPWMGAPTSFAFGAVLVEMPTARKAFDGDSAAAIMASVLNADPPALEAAQQLAPRSLDRLLRSASQGS